MLAAATAVAWMAAAGDGGQAPAGDRDPARFRLKVFAGAAERDWIAGEGFDVAGHDLHAGWVEVITDTAGLDRLRGRGFVVEVLERRDGPRPLEQGSHGEPGVDAPLPDTRYHDPAEVQAFLEQVAADHPAIARLESIGTSTEGRPIWALMISDNAALDEDELSILFNGAHHAREVMTPEVVMDLIDYLTDNYGVLPEVTARVDAHEIWCVPMVNPDGVTIVHTLNDLWRKNTRDNDGNGSHNTSNDGVDLNRNYAWGWGNQCNGSGGGISGETYRGPWQASEPETQTVLALTRRIRPVFDVDYHSFGEQVLYAMSCHPAVDPALSTIVGPNQSISRVIAEGYAAAIVQADGQPGYTPLPYASAVDGTGRDQQYHENGTIAFVTEINSSGEGGFAPDYAVWRDPTVEGHRPGWLWLIDRMTGPAVGGQVRDAVSGLPLEADVGLEEMSLPDGKRLTSDPDTGRYHLIVVPGSYTLRASAPGYAGATVPVTVGSTWTPTDVFLAPLGSSTIVVAEFEDPATVSQWTVGGPGDTATDGFWAWGEPHGTHDGFFPSTLRLGNARLDRSPGERTKAFVTGNALSASWMGDDVDGGATTLTSPSFDLAGLYGVEASWQRWFRKEPGDPVDSFEAQVSTNGGAGWVTMERLVASTSTSGATPAWAPASVVLDNLVPLGPDVRFRFRVEDASTEHVVEGAVDDLVVTGYSLALQGEPRGVQVTDPVATVVSWDPVPGPSGVVYDVVRGDLAALGGGAGGVDLGTLTCIENDSTDLSTAGDEDAGALPPGTGLFYLVRFGLGLTVGGYGAGSAGGARAGTGGCPP